MTGWDGFNPTGWSEGGSRLATTIEALIPQRTLTAIPRRKSSDPQTPKRLIASDSTKICYMPISVFTQRCMPCPRTVRSVTPRDTANVGRLAPWRRRGAVSPRAGAGAKSLENFDSGLLCLQPVEITQNRRGNPWKRLAKKAPELDRLGKKLGGAAADRRSLSGRPHERLEWASSGVLNRLLRHGRAQSRPSTSSRDA